MPCLRAGAFAFHAHFLLQGLSVCSQLEVAHVASSGDHQRITTLPDAQCFRMGLRAPDHQTYGVFVSVNRIHRNASQKKLRKANKNGLFMFCMDSAVQVEANIASVKHHAFSINNNIVLLNGNNSHMESKYEQVLSSYFSNITA